MSYTIQGKKIKMTRGDTIVAPIEIMNQDGTPYEMQPGDSVRFKMRGEDEDSEPIITKDVTSGTLTIAHEDTASLDTGSYFFDVQMTFASGSVDTFIPEGTVVILPEADKKEP